MINFPYNNLFYFRNNYNRMKHFNRNLSKSENHINKEENQKREQAYDETVPFIFEIMGLKIYLDDLIIFSVLFFLYKEDVKDNLLYILLFLLLFS